MMTSVLSHSPARVIFLPFVSSILRYCFRLLHEAILPQTMLTLCVRQPISSFQLGIQPSLNVTTPSFARSKARRRPLLAASSLTAVIGKSWISARRRAVNADFLEVVELLGLAVLGLGIQYGLAHHVSRSVLRLLTSIWHHGMRRPRNDNKGSVFLYSQKCSQASYLLTEP